MKQYLRCLKTARGVNSPECRELSKNYLSCRMERGLMAPDEMKNLGYAEGQTATDDVGKGIKKWRDAHNRLLEELIWYDMICEVVGEGLASLAGLDDHSSANAVSGQHWTETSTG
jgi:hypothetical protein